LDSFQHGVFAPDAVIAQMKAVVTPDDHDGVPAQTELV
jgi:hypothetical protein